MGGGVVDPVEGRRAAPRSAVRSAALGTIERHTRSDEEAGRLELLTGGRLGPAAPLAAALIVAFAGCAVLGLLTSAALAATGLPVGGSFVVTCEFCNRRYTVADQELDAAEDARPS